jgi:hypothetical protein
MTVSPMSSHKGSGASRRKTPRRSAIRYRPGFRPPVVDRRVGRSL